jgi:hypothetical protein
VKLKEKLAKESAKASVDTGMNEKTAYFYGYLHGFEKAREMAVEDALNWDDIELRCMNDCCLKISNRLNTLGEEEV